MDQPGAFKSERWWERIWSGLTGVLTSKPRSTRVEAASWARKASLLEGGEGEDASMD
jgi:hypothetical protein